MIGTDSKMEADVDKLRSLRKQRVMSMRELAEKAGVSKNTVWNLENGTGRAHAQTIRKLAGALGVDPSELTTS